MNARTLLLFAFMCLGTTATAQGFAGLGTTAEGFATPSRGTVLRFPEDHGAHPEFRIEWWYLTANLTGPDGRDYGVQWTLFRSALAPREDEGWQSPQLWMGHAAATAPEAHFVTERRARGGIGQAGVTASPFLAWIDDWTMRGAPGRGLERLDLTASGPEFSYDLNLLADGPLVLHGDRGYSVKSAQGQASHYYSQPFYSVTGTLNLAGEEVAVRGEAWLDREWSSQPLGESQSGWDWFSLSFDSGAKMMGFRLRDDVRGDYTSATWIDRDGRATPLDNGALTMKPLSYQEVAGRSVPVDWQLDLPERDLSVQVRAINRRAWMATSFPYWEGPVRVTGSHAGRGYLEMTGYAPER